MAEGISFSNLFVDITNKRQQETSRQLSQVTGALDQIAGHKKQVRLAAEREETLKDNEEFKLQKRQQGLLVDNMDILGQYSDEDISGFTGVDPKTGENLGWTNQTMDIFEQDIAGKRVTAKKEADEIELKAKDDETRDTYHGKYGVAPYKNDEGQWMVKHPVTGKVVDADDYKFNYNQAKNIKTETVKLNTQTQKEKDIDQQYRDNNLPIPELGYNEKKANMDNYKNAEEDIAGFPSNMKNIYDNITFTDGKPVREISAEEYERLISDYSPVRLSATTRGKKVAADDIKKNAIKIKKDGIYVYIIPITSDYLEDKLGLGTTKEGREAYKDLLQYKQNVDYIEGFGVPEVGDIKKGEGGKKYKFIGGDQYNEQNWEEVK